MHIFVDFEASSLGDDSYPIEVGWAAEDGGVESHLIRPAPPWTDWDAAAEAVHGISRAALEAQGEPHDQVARRVLEALDGQAIFASAPSWDGKWLSVLLRGAGLPRHALRLRDSDEAHLAAAAEILRPALPERGAGEIAARLLDEARARIASGPPRHRALADAQAELEIWREVQRLARAEVQRLRA